MATRFEQERLLTIEEFVDLPDDGVPYELVEGRLVPRYLADDGTAVTGSFADHGAVAARLLVALWQHVNTRRLGVVLDAQVGMLVRRNPDTMRAPDVKYISWNRLPDRVIPRSWLPIAPELVVEVLSHNDRASDVLQKIREYFDRGVLLVWLADPMRRAVTAFTPDGSTRIYGERDTLDGGTVLPDLAIPVAPLFEFDGPPADV